MTKCGFPRIKQKHEIYPIFNILQPAHINTPDKQVAHRFATDSGIILTLKSGAISFNKNNDNLNELFSDDNKIINIPKYMSVGWLSKFPKNVSIFLWQSGAF